MRIPRSPWLAFAFWQLSLFASMQNAAASILWVVQPATGDIVAFQSRTGALINRFPAPLHPGPDDWRIGLSMAENGNTLLYQLGNPIPGAPVPADTDPDRNRLYRLDPWTGEIKSVEDGLRFFFGADGISYQHDGVRDLIFYSQANPLPQIHLQEGYGADEFLHWPPNDFRTIHSRGGVAGDGNGREFSVYLDVQELFPGDTYIGEYDPFVPGGFINVYPAPTDDIEGLAFDGRLLYASTASGMFYAMDPDTGSLAQPPLPLPGGHGGFGLGASIPEPAAVLLLAIGLAGAGLTRRLRGVKLAADSPRGGRPVRTNQGDCPGTNRFRSGRVSLPSIHTH